MVAHDAEGKEPGRHLLERLYQDSFKRRIVCSIEEKAFTPYRAIHDVEDEAAGVCECSMRHRETAWNSNPYA